MSDQIQLFRKPMEYVNLLFPVILLFFAVSEMLSGRLYLSSYSGLISFMQDVIFFNGLHICFTYIVIFCTPAGRSAAFHYFQEFGKKGLLRIALVFFGSVLMYFYFNQFVQPSSLWQLFFYVPLLFARRKHDLGQSKGLLRIANLQTQKNLKESAAVSKFLLIQKWEHRLIGVFFWTSTIAVFTFFNYKSSLGSIGLYLFWVTFPLSIAIALGLSACALMSPVGTRRWKLLFSARFYTKVLSPYSTLLTFGGASVHGIEYFCVTDKIIRHQRKEKKTHILLSPIVFSSLLFVTLLGYAVLYYPKFYLPSSLAEGETSALYAALVSIALGLTVTHYFLDHLLFTPKYKFAIPLLKALGDYEVPADIKEVKSPKESA